MPEGYIVIGATNGKKAGHASTIDQLVIAYKDGRTEEMSYSPNSKTNPGQDVLQYIDNNLPEANAVITGEMQGPPNYNKRTIINEAEESIAEIVKKYKNGEYDPIIEQQIKEAKEAEETPYGTPKKDGSGRGERGNKGRNPECEPDDYEEVGKGSGTKEGRAKEGKPKRTAYEPEGDYEGSEPEEGAEEATDSEGEDSSGED